MSSHESNCDGSGQIWLGSQPYGSPGESYAPCPGCSACRDAGDGGRVPDVSEQRAELPVGEVLGALEHGYHPQNPTQMHPADFIVKHFKLDGHQGLRDVRASDPASVLAALLAESPEATVEAARDLSYDELSRVERWRAREQVRLEAELQAARPPQGEDHEARVETVARILGRGGWRDEDGVWHEGITVRDWSRAADIVAALDDLSRVPPSRDGTVAAEDMRAQAIAEAVQRLRQRAALWHGGEVEAAVVDECADFIEREFGSARAGESNEGGNRP